MTRAISRESFNELKNYLGVYLQQGRPILDADWNENQDIAVSFLRRVTREGIGDGSPNGGFLISPVFPPPLTVPEIPPGGLGGDLGQILGQILGICLADLLTILFEYIFGSLPFFLSFPGEMLDGFELLDNFSLTSPQGKLRIGRDRPYQGQGFLRLSGHAGTVQIVKTLPNLINLSAHEMATFRYRLNEAVAGDFKFFLEDDDGHRSEWLVSNPAFGTDFWFSGFATPLDIRFRVITSTLEKAYQGDSYHADLHVFGGSPLYTWNITGLPAPLMFSPGAGAESNTCTISGTPAAAGSFNIHVEVTDSTSKVATRDYVLVIDPGDPPPNVINIPLSFTQDALALMMQPRASAPDGTPADLSKIRKYGFEVYQNGITPLVWDFDDLELGSAAFKETVGANNFIIRGSELNRFLNQLTLLSLLQSSGGGGGDPLLGGLAGLIDIANTEWNISDPSVENAGRIYVDGFPCVQIRDILYSDQADPNDPPLSPPPPGSPRKDTVYLDVWTEPVTYVQDPEIREIALGGPDTSTRLRVKYRVRVSQGGGVPTGNGIGQGTLATEGTYTAQANRLYLIEIDTPGNIGAATFRWSEDNGSTIGRVIAPVPPGSSTITVEDAAAFHTGDFILIRKEFGAERHQVASVFGNVIKLVGTTGAQLAALPAAAVVPNFTTFALSDRPMVQRWNAFQVPILADPADATISAQIPLNDGVAVRFGGRAMRAGDVWNFKTRYLAGDEVSGLNPVTRIEDLGFVRARGVVHHYAPLAVLTRDPSAPEPQKITAIEDRRERAGNAAIVTARLDDHTVSSDTDVWLGGTRLLPAALDSQLVVLVQADLYTSAPVSTDFDMTVTVSFYNDQITDPQADPDTGKIQDRPQTVYMHRKPRNVEIPVTLLFAKSDTAFLFLPQTSVPTSVQVFVKLSDTGLSVELTNVRVTVIELKKSF